jgi:hypothetical protein
MKNILKILIAGLLITHTFIAVTGLSDLTYDKASKQISFSFHEPDFSNHHNEYISVSHPLATSYMLDPGKPLLPVVTRTFQIPLGSTLTSVDVTYDAKVVRYLDTLLRPSPKPVIDGSDEIGEMPPCADIYQSSLSYPPSDFSYDVKVGLNNEKSVIFVNVHCYPMLYSPSDNKVEYYEEAEIEIEYNVPKTEVNYPDEYDLLIITPSEFTSSLIPLVEHKNAFGMLTKMVTLEEIYASGINGRDDAETIKLYIKQERETSGIVFVQLVGGHIGQSHEWYLPVRYGHSLSEDAYLSDLYYADLYKYENNETMFEDWDSNGDNIFAGFTLSSRDVIDGAPDIYIGRFACRSIEDVDIIVNKIITYEKQPADDSWFKKMLLIGGDTYPESPIAFEAEIDTNLSASYMNGFSFERLWASMGTLTNREDVEQAFNNGCGFIHMAGHANPSKLVTYPPYDKQKEQKITIMAMYDFYNFPKMNPILTNKEKQPVVVIGGCHNSQYNVTMANIIDGIKEYGFKNYFFAPTYRFLYMEWVPKCFSWWLTIKEDGGAIATLGNTGLGMGIWDYDYLTGLDGWLFPRFFYHYGQEGEEFVGAAQGAAITDYVNEFDINKDSEDRQMVQQWALLGDPSLKMGGYP